MSEHAHLSPSSSRKWMACPGSLVLEASIPQTPNQYSDDGTACHAVAAWSLTELVPPSSRIGEDILVSAPGEEPRWVEFSDEMAMLTETYVNAILRHLQGATAHRIEMRVDFSSYTDRPDSFGTADAVIVYPLGDEKYELQVHDAKFGYKNVEVEGNTQLRIYALGALADFELAYDITQVRIFIHQSRYRDEGIEETIDVEALRAWGANDLAHAANSVAGAAAEHGVIPIAEWNANYLNPTPNEKDCAFCRAMPVCPNLSKFVTNTVSNVSTPDIHDFAVVEPTTQTADADLARLMAAVPLIEDWCLATRAEIERRLIASNNAPEMIDALGFKLVAGRQGARKWTDTEEVEALLKQFRLTIEDRYNLKLKSPTQVEKDLVKTEKIGKTQTKKLNALITRSEPKPSVAPANDKRPALAITAPSAADFPVQPLE